MQNQMVTLNNIRKFIADHTGDMILSLLLLYNLVSPMEPFTWPGLCAGLVIRLPYFVLVWTPNWLKKDRIRTIMIGLTWAATLLYAALFHAEYRIFELTFYLIGYAALNLPVFRSWWLGLIILVGNGLLLYAAGVELHLIWLYTMAYIVTYIFCWGARIKRESRRESERHYAELQAVHDELSQAHDELQHTHEELERATVRLMHYAVIEERGRISMDLHDSIGNRLTSAIVQLQAIPYMMKVDATEADKAIGTVLDVVRQSLQEVRTVAHQMGSSEAGLGLVALNSLVSEVQKLTGCSIELRYAGQKEAWSQETSELLYRILQEALSNIIRHAQATQVSVHIKEQEEDLFMQVEDNGVFIQQQPLVPGFGLSSMKARCERVGGSMTIEAIHPHGMKLTVCIPHGGIKSTSGGGEL
ncbi:sensor histidine kinase [Paenibacillus polysaccharolyticus]|uniref:sensor histidine kinase n=1 Tax=Paenibacillus polysaccharolyticus TaxID=582692 RepID=UPI0020A16BD3|nr:sensor histidine kinase [Paenibacillus polysaccharolyticus]MCP1135685.1 sensor histidine kinase [Paenibacillus polysaccharolyticus]